MSFFKLRSKLVWSPLFLLFSTYLFFLPMWALQFIMNVIVSSSFARYFQPSGIHLLVSFPISKLYSNSVMCSLNSRRFWKTGNTSHGQWRSGFESETEILRVPDRASIKLEDEVESQRGNRVCPKILSGKSENILNSQTERHNSVG